MFYFYRAHPHRRDREHCKVKLPSFVGRQYERRYRASSFYGAIPRRGSHGNFPPNTKMMVTPGTTRRSLSSLSHSLTERVPADLRSQTSQIVRALVISRWTAPHTPLTLVVCDSFRQSTSHSFPADVSINIIDSMHLSPAHVGLHRAVRERGFPPSRPWSLDPNTL
jgi:hypothetical protein